MDDTHATVYVVDDNAEVRDAIGTLCRSTGLDVCSFASTEEFLRDEKADEPCCAVLDVRFPGAAATGLECQDRLRESGISLPIVFISGCADVRMSVEAMKRGAVDFLPKPFRDQELLDAIRIGLQRDRVRREAEEGLKAIRSRIAGLTPRQREMLTMMADGLMVKQMAGRLELSEVTIKVHRSRIMNKLGVRTPLELVRLVDRLLAAEEFGPSGVQRSPSDVVAKPSIISPPLVQVD